MLGWVVTFLIIALIAGVLGFGGIAGASIEVAKTIFVIVLVVSLFSALCFGFARDLAGGSPLGRFLSAFLGVFWMLRIFLQCFYYDSEVRRANRALDTLYLLSLVSLVGIFGWVVWHPVL